MAGFKKKVPAPVTRYVEFRKGKDGWHWIAVSGGWIVAMSPQAYDSRAEAVKWAQRAWLVFTGRDARP